MVTYSSAAYLALQASGPGAPKQPDTNPTYWQAMGGVKGDTGATGAGFGGSSTATITPAFGNKTFTSATAGLAWTAGMPIQATSASTPGSYMSGTVYSYASTTLIITVTSYAGASKSDWVFSAPTGAKGDQGVKGDTGATGDPGTAVNPRGAWLIGTTYAQFDGVTYTPKGKAYISLQAANVGHEPDTSPTYWEDSGGGESLPTGNGVVAVTSGVGRIADPNIDYMAALAGNGMLKLSSGAPALASAGADYLLPTTYGYAPLNSAYKVPSTYLPDSSASGYDAGSYNWYGMSPGGTLTGGDASNTITVPGICPTGVNGSDVNHVLLLTDATTPANTEVITITGGTARSGVAGGTLTFPCHNAHTGTWSLGSASMGIKEAAVVAIAAAYSGGYPNLLGPGVVIRISGNFWIYGTIYIPEGTPVLFQGDPSTILECHVANKPVFDCDSACVFRDITMGSAAPQTVGGCAIRFGNGPTGDGVVVIEPVIKDCHFSAGFYDCIVGKTTRNIKSTDNFAVNFVNTFVSPSSGGDMCSLTSTNDTTVCIGMSAPAFASVYFTSGWCKIINPSFGSGVHNNQIQYGVKGYITTTSTSATNITGGAIAYFATSGFELEVNGSGIFYQYVTIVGCNIHAEDTNVANTLVKFVASGGSPGVKNVTIVGNTLQGGGSSSTGLDLTGVTGTATLGLYDITLCGVPIIGYNPWLAPTFETNWSNFGSGNPNAGYCADGVVLRVCGWITTSLGGGAGWTQIFTALPVGFRPLVTRYATITGLAGGSTATPCTLKVDTAGNVSLYNTGTNEIFILDCQLPLY
jgi:hypothetical protein